MRIVRMGSARRSARSSGRSTGYESSRRRGGERHKPAKGNYDILTRVLLAQAVLSIALLGGCMLLRLQDNEPYYKAREWYWQVSAQPALPNPVTWVMAGGLDDLRESVTEVFAPRSDSTGQPSEPNSTPQQDVQQSAGQEQAQSASRLGRGGLWPWKTNEQETAEATVAVPQGCWVGPVVLAAPGQSPVSGTLTSAFGVRSHPLSGEGDFHRGIDIAAPMGANIYAMWPGVVSEVGVSEIYGNYIKLEHSQGLATLYCHCSEILAQPGTKLRQGDRIALVGSTGISTGPHLHLDLLVAGQYVNPLYAFDLADYAL